MQRIEYIGFFPSIPASRAELLEAEGHYYRTGKRLYIYVPGILATDSQCPLTGERGEVKIVIDPAGKRLIVKPA
jgi:hypothetical protein